MRKDLYSHSNYVLMCFMSLQNGLCICFVKLYPGKCEGSKPSGGVGKVGMIVESSLSRHVFPGIFND